MLAKRINQTGKVIILSETTDEPISLIGEMAGVCYNSETNSHEKNYKRGLDCIRSGHERAMEYPQIYMIIDGYSAKVIRELYTHIIDVSRLQASTRYIDYSNFEFVVPPSIKNNNEALKIYNDTMGYIANSMQKLEELGIPKEDFSGLLPLNYKTKIVLRVGLRELVNICKQRLCSRAYHEMRELIKDILDSLCFYSDEWKFLVEEEKIFVPKCKAMGYCPEKYSCGAAMSKADFMSMFENNWEAM